METAYDKMAMAMSESKDVWKLYPDYYLFEGYDVKERPADVLRLALKDGVDLNAPYFVRHIPSAPHSFQNGYLLSTKFFRGMFAANRDGKSLTAFMEIQMRLSGEIPIAYRYPEGYDTGIPRIVCDENVRRFGRRAIGASGIIDYNTAVMDDETWNCGNVKGRGVFPTSKIVPNGSTLRLGSYQKIILANWWPAFTGRAKDALGKFFLETALDINRGSHTVSGSNKQDFQVFYKGNKTLQILTYESGPEKFESIEPPTYLDEEPPNDAFIGAVVTHCTDWSLIETPIFGVTYTKDLIFPDSVSHDKEIFHATTYDCPYHTADMISKRRDGLSDRPWEIGARLWGIPTEQRGKPYYDRVKINLWIQRFKLPYRLVSFHPTEEWDRIKTNTHTSRLKGLMDVSIEMREHHTEDRRSVWRLYKDREDGIGYVIPSDQADGAEYVEDVGDWSVAGVGCQRDAAEDPNSPVICATLRSSLPTTDFTREVMYAARYFNNAMLAPESGKGAANATFEAVATDWPYWFKDTIEKWSTRKPKENRGFCPTTDRRETIFDKLIRDWFAKYDEDTYPEIPDEWILREAASAVVGKTNSGKNTRCDHPNDGTIDALTMYGIMLFVMQPHFCGQIRSRGGRAKKEHRKTWLELAEEAAAPKPRPFGLGTRILHLR